MQHVHRVEQQHVEPTPLLADEEQRGDQGRLPDCRADELSPVRHSVGFAGDVRAAHVFITVDGQRGDRRRHRDRDRGCRFDAQPRLGRVRFAGALVDPEPHVRLRHQEHGRTVDGAEHEQYQRHCAPFDEHGYHALEHHAQPHEYGHQRQVQGPILGGCHFAHVQEHARSRPCGAKRSVL